MSEPALKAGPIKIEAGIEKLTPPFLLARGFAFAFVVHGGRPEGS